MTDPDIIICIGFRALFESNEIFFQVQDREDFLRENYLFGSIGKENSFSEWRRPGIEGKLLPENAINLTSLVWLFPIIILLYDGVLLAALNRSYLTVS